MNEENKISIQKIFEEWDKDCKIDVTELTNESLKISQLHNKYYKLYVVERMKLRKLVFDLKQLKLEKHTFYKDGPSKEQIDAGWELPPRGRILVSDIPMYLDADKDMIDVNIKIGLQEEKIELLESILDSISKRGYQIKNAIEFEKFKNGG